MLIDWDRNYWFNIGRITAFRHALNDQVNNRSWPADKADLTFQLKNLKEFLCQMPSSFDDKFYKEAGEFIDLLFDEIDKTQFDEDLSYELIVFKIRQLIEQIDKALPSEVVSQYNDIF